MPWGCSVRFPDPRAFIDAPRRVFRVHPFTAMSSLVLFGLLLVLNHLEWMDRTEVLHKFALMAGWAVPLFFAAETFTRGGRGVVDQSIRGSVLVILALWYFLVPSPFGTVEAIQYALWVGAATLAGALARRDAGDAFWQWNRLLFLRILETTAFAVVLNLGADGALWTLESLFKVDVPSEAWMDVWIVSAVLFAPFHFLSGMPDHGEQVEPRYPTALRLFSTRVLLPLAVLYLGLLYAYGGKILLSWSLPNGMVSAPILAFAAFGILAQLLLEPLVRDDGLRWVRLWTRWFHALLLPLCVLLGVAIGRRVLDYGITEQRYAVIVIAIWLPIQATWFLLGRRDLRFVPASFIALCLICGWGPWGVFETSRRSQVSRLESRLAKLGSTPGHPGSTKPSVNEIRRINDEVDYLCENHRGRGLERWSPSVERMRKRADSASYHVGAVHGMADSVMRDLGVRRLGRWKTIDTAKQELTVRGKEVAADAVGRVRLESIDTNWSPTPRDTMVGFRIRSGADAHVFSWGRLLDSAATGSRWIQMDTSPILPESLGRSILIVKIATMERDSTKVWRLKSLEGLLLR